MILRQLFDRESSTYTYLIGDPGTRHAALIDPVREQIERDLTYVRELGLELTYVLETHVHADHVTAASLLRERTGAKTAASAAGAPCVDITLRHGEVIRVGDLAVTALATPGHTDDGISYVVEGHVFTGDTLLIRGCGRSDFQNGDAGTLFDSITRVLFALPPETVVLPAHDYRGATSSTIGEEMKHNARVAGRGREDFIALMNGLDLPPPAHLATAVPANRACGRTEPVQEHQTNDSTESKRRRETMSIATAATTNASGIKEVSPRDVDAHRAEVRLVDVREPHEFTGELGHIPGAELVPLATVTDAAKSWDKDADIVLVCRSGKRSGTATAQLAAMGFGRVYNMAGGMLAYGEAKLPLER